jgi:hypothetical protein
MKRLAVVVLACTAVGGCASPEATRQRGGGPGGDPGNRPTQVKMHEGSRQYWHTPVLIPGEGPHLAASEQARYLSLPSTDPSQTPSVGGGQGR